MSEYDDEEWFEDWYVDDVENLSDTLATTAYGHEPPFAPEGYDAYDSDLGDFYTDGEDDYFDGPLGSPSPPSTPAHKNHLTGQRINSNLVLLTPTSATPPTPQPSKVAGYLGKIEIKFKEAMIGKKFYGEPEEGDEKFLGIGVRRRRHLAVSGRGGKGVRKRRKVEHPSELVRGQPSLGSNSSGSIGVVEIGGRGDAGSEEDEDNDDGSAEGYNSDGLDGEEERLERRRGLRGEVEIRPPGKPGGGEVRKWVGGTGRRNKSKASPQVREKAVGGAGVSVGGRKHGEKKGTTLR